MTAKTLRLLLVETSDADAQRTLSKLEQAGYLLQSKRVSNASDMKAALSAEPYDIVLCSYDPPGFGGLPALELLQASGVDIPFLFLSHDLREETILHTMQRGADDYIFKGSLNRLSSAIEHNLREARIRRDHRAAQQALQESQLRLHAFVASLPGMAFQMQLLVDGSLTFPYVSEGCLALLGVSPMELTGNPSLFESLLHPDDLEPWRKSVRESAAQRSFWNWEGRVRTVDSGTDKWINLRSTPHSLEQGTLWIGIVFDITQSKQTELEVRQSKAQLRELSSHIQEVREQERIAIAREVHDDMGSTLTAIKLDIAWLAGRLAGQPALAEKAKGIEALVDKCSAAARNISHSLRPSVLDTFGIVAAIEMEADDFERRTGISCVFNCGSEIEAVPPDISTALFRIFQEALANITKHAQASEVEVSMSESGSGIELTVQDNGRGLSAADRSKPRSFGLHGIRERVEYFGGRAIIESQPGQGTRLCVLIPRNKATALEELLAQQKLF